MENGRGKWMRRGKRGVGREEGSRLYNLFANTVERTHHLSMLKQLHLTFPDLCGSSHDMHDYKTVA